MPRRREPRHQGNRASADFMTHLAMWEGPDPAAGLAETTWGEHVTDAEYAAAAESL